MGRVTVAARASMHADSIKLLRSETRECEVIQVDKTVKKPAAGIELYRQPAFREVYLNSVRTLVEAAAYLCFVFPQQVIDELGARVAGNLCRRIHEAQGGR